MVGTAVGAAALGALLAARATDGWTSGATALGAARAAAVASGSAAALAVTIDRTLAVSLGLLAALDRGLGLTAGFVRGAALAAAVPRGRALRTACVSSAGPALVTAALWGAQALPLPLALVGTSVTVTSSFALAATALGALYVEADASLALHPRASAPSLPRVTRRFFAGAAGIALLSAALLAAVAAVPAPFEPTAQVRGVSEAEGWTTLDLSGEQVLPGTRVRVSAVADGLVFSMPDGGGAGRVRGVDRPISVRVRNTRCGGEECFEVVAGGAEGAGRTFVDRSGVRRDDGLGVRVTRRVSRLCPWAALFALVSFAIALALAGRGIAGAEVLSAPDDEARARSDGRPRVVEGRLVAPAPAALHPVGRHGLRVEGAAFVQCDVLGVRLALPQGADVRLARGTSIERLCDGARVAVITALPRRGAGYREGALPWPADAVLVPGGLEGARAAFAAQLDRRIAPLGVVTVVALLFVAVELSLALLRP